MITLHNVYIENLMKMLNDLQKKIQTFKTKNIQIKNDEFNIIYIIN